MVEHEVVDVIVVEIAARHECRTERKQRAFDGAVLREEPESSRRTTIHDDVIP
jgi:hypothetical protein